MSMAEDIAFSTSYSPFFHQEGRQGKVGGGYIEDEENLGLYRRE
jgi:hypothetical protein